MLSDSTGSSDIPSVKPAPPLFRVFRSCVYTICIYTCLSLFGPRLDGNRVKSVGDFADGSLGVKRLVSKRGCRWSSNGQTVPYKPYKPRNRTTVYALTLPALWHGSLGQPAPPQFSIVKTLRCLSKRWSVEDWKWRAGGGREEGEGLACFEVEDRESSLIIRQRRKLRRRKGINLYRR